MVAILKKSKMAAGSGLTHPCYSYFGRLTCRQKLNIAERTKIHSMSTQRSICGKQPFDWLLSACCCCEPAIINVCIVLYRTALYGIVSRVAV